MKPTSILFFCLLPLLAACPGIDADKALMDDTAEPDDSAPPVDTDTGDTGGETGDSCPDMPALDLAELLPNLWTGSWRGVENAGWFRWNQNGEQTFTGLAWDPAEPAREDYAGTWAWGTDGMTVELDYVDHYPLGEEGPLAVSQTITPILSTDTNEDGCTVPALDFEWGDFDTVEGFESLSGTMHLLLHD